jgi:hypothetical protein
MSKIQAMIGLFILIVVVFSMNMMFPITETFINKGFGLGIGGLGGSFNGGVLGSGLGSQVAYQPIIRQNTLNGNEIYSGNGYLGATPPYQKNNQSDDQPLYFGFSS